MSALHPLFSRIAKCGFSVLCVTSLSINHKALAADIVVDSTITTQQEFDSDGQKLSIVDGGNLTVLDNNAAYSDSHTGLTIDIDTNVLFGGISSNNSSAIAIFDTAQISEINLYNGQVDSLATAGTVFLGGAGGTTAITLSGGTSINNNSLIGSAITSDTISDTTLTINNGGTISATGSAIVLNDDDGGSSYTISNSGTITSTNGDAISVTVTTNSNEITLNNSGEINGNISLSTNTNTINNDSGTINGAISSDSALAIHNRTGINVINGDISSVGALTFEMNAGNTITGDITSFDDMNISVTNDGENTINGDLSSVGNLTLSFASGDTLNGNIFTNSDLIYNTTATGGNQINATTIEAEGTIDFNLSSNDIISGDILAFSDVAITDTNTGSNSVTGDISSTNGGITIAVSAASIYTGNLTASTTIEINSTSTGGNEFTGNLTSSGDITINFSAGDSLSGNIDTGENFTFNSTSTGGNSILADTINALGGVTFNLSANDHITGTINSVYDVGLYSTSTGGIVVEGDINSFGGSVEIGMNANESFTGAISAASDISIGTTGTGTNSVSGDLTSYGGSVQLAFNNNDVFTGAISALNYINIGTIGTGTNSFSGNLTSDSGDISLNFVSNDVFTGDINAGGNFTYTTFGSGSNLLDATSITTGGTATFYLVEDDTINGDTVADGAISVYVTGSGGNSFNGNITSNNDIITINMISEDSINGNISGFGDVFIGTYGSGTNVVTGDVSSTNGNIIISFISNDVLTGDIDAFGNLTFSTYGSGNNKIDAATINAGGAISINTFKDDIINGTITAVSDINITDFSFDGGLKVGNDITSTGGAISLSLKGLSEISGNIQADGDVTIGVYGAGSNVLAGNITSDNGDVNLTLNTGDQINGDISAASNITYESSTGANTFSGNLTAGGDIALYVRAGDSFTGNMEASGNFTYNHVDTTSNVSINGNISVDTGDLAIGLINGDAITGNLTTGAGQAVITLENDSNITGDVDLGSNATSSFLMADNSTFIGNITMGDAAQSADLGGSSVSGSINGPGIVQISATPTSYDFDIGNNSAITKLVITANNSLDTNTNSNILNATNIELYDGSQLTLGSATTSGAIDGLTAGRGSVTYAASTTKDYDIGSTASIASVTINEGVELTNSGSVIADNINILNGASLVSSSGVIGVATAPITLYSGANLTINGGSIDGKVDGHALNNGVLTIGTTFNNSLDIGSIHALEEVAVTSAGSFTNNAELNAQTLNVAGTFITDSSGSLQVNNIINSGTITTTDGDGIIMTGDNITITNSGTIRGSNPSNQAINIDGDNLTLNILTGSTIVGNIMSSGDNNILNIKTNYSLTQYGFLRNRLINTSNWTANIAAGGSLTIVEAEDLDFTNLTGGTITNSGTLSSLAVFGSGNILNLTSTHNTGNISNSGALTISNSSNIIYENEISGTGAITKSGSGRLELTGINSYSGNTTVSNGELKINGSIANSDVTVANGAMISGNGTTGDLTIQSGGILAPGNSPGTINVSGILNLAGGSISNFEFSSTQIDKIIASGNININPSAILDFQLSGADGYFTVSQDILQSTGGTVSGSFGTVNTQSGYTSNLTYGSSAVNATISRNLNSNSLDGALSSQNSVGRLVAKSLSDQMRNSQYYNDKKTHAWVSSGSFNSYMAANGDSAAYSTNGFITSAGMIANFDDFQLVGGVFNSHSKVKRFVFSGKDEIETNGFALGLGKNFKNALGNLYTFTQFGAGFYNFTNTRNVNVNGSYQAARGRGQGEFEYLGIGAAQTIPTNLRGELAIFTSATLQRTSHDGWNESGLSAGNLHISRSRADTLNFEIGTSYKDEMPKFLHLKKGSFYKFEFSGYKSELNSKKDALVTQNSANYSLAPTYNQKFTLGGSAFFSTPLTENSSITARFDKRQNGTFREFIGTLGYIHNF